MSSVTASNYGSKHLALSVVIPLLGANRARILLPLTPMSALSLALSVQDAGATLDEVLFYPFLHSHLFQPLLTHNFFSYYTETIMKLSN